MASLITLLSFVIKIVYDAVYVTEHFTVLVFVIESVLILEA